MADNHALVIGGSMAGLLAARALAGYFGRVTIVERDQLSRGPEPRKGLPQARHVHVLLWRGQQSLEKLFPGLQSELEQASAPQMDWIGDARWFSGGGWTPRFASGYVSHPCSRDLLEWLLRRRLDATRGVRFVSEGEVVDLLANEAGTRIRGVRLRHRGQADLPFEELQADLVVDTSGRDSRVPHWLEQLGYPLPQDTVINSYLGYATRVYQKPRGQNDWKSLIMRGNPPGDKRGGVIHPIEGERWMVTLAGAGKDYPPTDEAGFLEFARSLPAPLLYDSIKDALPLTPISGYRKTENRWRHFEGMKRWPEGLIVMGDAVCAFNPVYGQGMTAAAMEALALEGYLRERNAGGDGWAHGVQTRLAKIVSGPWLMATGEDYRYAETEGGKRDAMTRFFHGYMDRVLWLANTDRAVFMTFFEVFQLVKPVSAFFAPAILAKVVRRGGRRG